MRQVSSTLTADNSMFILGFQSFSSFLKKHFFLLHHFDNEWITLTKCHAKYRKTFAYTMYTAKIKQSNSAGFFSIVRGFSVISIALEKHDSILQ